MALEQLKKIEKLIEAEGVGFIDLKAVDLRGQWRHLTIPAAQLSSKLLGEGVGFDGSNYGYRPVQQSDLLLVPDLTTAKIENFSCENYLSLICDIYQVQGGVKEPLAQGPRWTARRAEGYLQESGIADQLQLSPEFEFYIFDKVDFAYRPEQVYFCVRSSEVPSADEGRGAGHYLKPQAGYHAPRPADRLMDLRSRIVNYLERESIQVKYHHHETGGAGQGEIEIGFFGLREAADLTLFIKHAVRNLAAQEGKTATFMPKPLYSYPGNGMHLHQYLIEDKKNAFDDPAGYGRLSKLALHYIGGLLSHGRSLMAFTNPSINSYRRLMPGYEAPVSFTFGLADRSGAVRIPGYVSDSAERRIELRTIDATCNPYLAYSAILMAGIDGIERELDPKEEFGPYKDEPPSHSSAESKFTPGSLEQALQALEEDHEYLLKKGVFNEEQLSTWLELKRSEARDLCDKPHPYEYLLYYDL